MASIVARLFGGMELRDGKGRELAPATRKAAALLAFLMVERHRWHARSQLAHLLWGGRQEAQARSSLNQALHEIRKIEVLAGVDLLERETDRVRFVSGEGIDCDFHRFEGLLETDPRAAADLFDVRLLERLELAEPDYRDWLDQKRAHCRERLAQALRKQGGLAAARRLVDLDPLDEAARRQLMLLLAEVGERVEAVRQYEVCAALLRDELGLAPDAETTRVLAEIKRAPASPQVIAPAFAPDGRLELVDGGETDARPLLAVYPFANLSDDPGLGYFADGLADDLIYVLGRLRWFRVLARGTTFALRDLGPDPAGIRTASGATHLVTGSVRQAGGRLRLTAELVDTRTGQQLWSARHDRTLDGLFELQDELCRSIAASLEPALEDSEMRRALARPPATLAAYDLLQRGYWHLYRDTPADHEQARHFVEAALAKDPAYAGALAALAFVKYRDAHAYRSASYEERMTDCRDTAGAALQLDPHDPRALRYYGGACSFLGDQESALDALRRAIELAPSFATAYSGLAFTHDFRGAFAEASPAADQTIRLRPHDSTLYKCIIAKSIAQYQIGNYDQSERVARQSMRSNVGWWLSNLMLAASAGKLGHGTEAGEALRRVRGGQPGVSLEALLRQMPFADPSHTDHLAEGLIAAGWKD